MSIIDTPTLDQVLTLAQKLPRREQAQLVAQIVTELADTPLVASPDAADDGWARFFAVSAEIRSAYPDVDVTKRLEQDRQEREAVLRGSAGLGGETDVHP